MSLAMAPRVRGPPPVGRRTPWLRGVPARSPQDPRTMLSAAYPRNPPPTSRRNSRPPARANYPLRPRNWRGHVRDPQSSRLASPELGTPRGELVSPLVELGRIIRPAPDDRTAACRGVRR